MKTSHLAILCATFLSSPLSAEQIGPAVQSDLDGDGLLEVFRLIDSGAGSADLQITHPNRGVLTASEIAWHGGLGRAPELSLAPNGSLQVTSKNDSIGRSRWYQTLTIAYRAGDYRVAGFTYSWYDTLSQEDQGTCDLNLLTGAGHLEVNSKRRDVRTQQKAIAVADWRYTTPIPPACGI